MAIFYTNKTYVEELGIKGGPQQGDTEEEVTPTEEEPNPEGDDTTEEEPTPEGDDTEEEPNPEGDNDTEEEPNPEGDDTTEEEPNPEGGNTTEEEPAPEDDGNDIDTPDNGGESSGEGDSDDLETPDDGEEESDEESSEEGDEDGDGEADSVDTDQIKAMEDEIFSGLSDAQKLIKVSELKGSFSKLYRSCDMIFNKIDIIPKSDDNLLVLERITNTLSDLKQYIEHYLMYTFDTKTYLENETNLQKFISIFNAVKEIFAQISKQKA